MVAYLCLWDEYDAEGTVVGFQMQCRYYESDLNAQDELKACQPDPNTSCAHRAAIDMQRHLATLAPKAPEQPKMQDDDPQSYLQPVRTIDELDQPSPSRFDN